MNPEEENQSEPEEAADAPAVDETAPTAEEENPGTEEAAEPEEEKDPLTLAQEEAAKWKDLAARNQAELENFRKRMSREKSDAIRFANGSLLTELLPIIDNFEMGLGAAKAESEDSIITKGMEMVHRQIEEFLVSNGAKEVAADSGKFDPLQHEAVNNEHDDKVPEGEIIRQLRKGYKMHDRLLRAANVVVSKGPAPADGEEGETETQPAEPTEAQA
ncbi:MAG: nucleotide exchange factor GrpE [Verrucomicrobiota bacterium]